MKKTYGKIIEAAKNQIRVIKDSEINQKLIYIGKTNEGIELNIVLNKATGTIDNAFFDCKEELKRLFSDRINP
jgi:hypothetical protein